MSDTDFEWLNHAYDELVAELERRFASLPTKLRVIVPKSELLKKQLGTVDHEPKRLSFAVMTMDEQPIFALATMIHLPAERRTMYQLHGLMVIRGRRPVVLFWSPPE